MNKVFTAVGAASMSLMAACLINTNSVSASEVIFNPLQSAVPSLTIAPDARGGGMGDVGAATKPDLNSQYWNPAKYAQMEGQGGAALSYTPWLRKIVSDIDLVYLSGYYKINEGRAISASLRYFSYGEINLTDMPGPTGEVVSTGTANPYEFSVDLGYSQMLSEYWSAAVALRFICSDITNGISSDGASSEAGHAVGADVAAFYRKPLYLGETGKPSYLSFGGNISNIGSKISYDGGDTEEFIPTNLRLGAGYEYNFDDYNSLSLFFDVNKLLVPTSPVAPEPEDYEGGASSEEYKAAYEKYENDYKDYRDKSSIGGIFTSFGDAPGGFSEEMKEIMWSLGLEYTYNKMFSVRGGYYHESESKGNRKYFSVGAGFKLSVFELNAAYLISTASSNPLDQTLRFSLGFNIDGLKKLAEN